MKTFSLDPEVIRRKTAGRLNRVFFFKYLILSNSDIMALGELVEDSRGKITGQRVLDAEIPKMETSFAMEETWY